MNLFRRFGQDWCASKPAFAARIAALVTVLVGFGVVLGWACDLPVLTRIHPALPAMRGNTALCFILLGSSLWLALGRAGKGFELRRMLAQSGAGLVMLVGLATFCEHVFNRSFFIDQLAFGHIPGRMSSNTAIAFVFCGAAVLY